MSYPHGQPYDPYAAQPVEQQPAYAQQAVYPAAPQQVMQPSVSQQQFQGQPMPATSPRSVVQQGY